VFGKPISRTLLSPAHHGRGPSPTRVPLSFCSSKLAEEQGSTASLWLRLRLARRARHTTAADPTATRSTGFAGNLLAAYARCLAVL